MAACVVAAAAGLAPRSAAATERDAPATEQIAGALMVPVTLVVIDEQTAEPLGRAEVTFFTAAEVETLDAIASGRKPAPADKRDLPSGVSVHSAKNGEVRMTCEFAATFVEARQGADTRVTKTRIQPTGRFVVKKAGYAPVAFAANALFAAAPDQPLDLTRPVKLRLHKTAAKT